MFAVVDHDEQFAWPQVPGDHLLDRGAFAWSQTPRLTDGGHDEGWISDGSQLHQPRPIGHVAHQVSCGLDRQPGLAGPTDTGEHDEPVVRYQTTQFFQLACPTDKRGEVVGQVVAADVHRLDRPVHYGKIGMSDLEHVLWVGQVLEVMRAEILKLESAIEVHPGRDGGQQDLAAMPGRHDAGRPVQNRSEVVAVPLLGRPGVDPHPDLDGRPRPVSREKTQLNGGGGGNGIVVEAERHRERIPGSREHVATSSIDLLPHDLVVQLEAGRHCV